MSDYISKSALIELFKSLADEHETNSISYKALCEVILQQPTLDEKEIIRKAFERVVERLECIEIGGDCRHKCNHYDWSVGACNGECTDYVKSKTIEILKEECGISD